MADLVTAPCFWRGRRVFITGHTGFKGSWLSLWLQSLGAKVTGYSLPPPTQPNLFDLGRVGQGMHSVIGEVNDLPALRHALHEASPEIVLHLAAQSLVHAGYEDPVGTYRTNVMGTVHLFQAVRDVGGVKAVVNITTDKCYENREWVWGYREVDQIGGRDPYSNSKACAELVTAAFRDSFFSPAHYVDHGVAVASARAGNVIGGGDWGRDRLIPDIFRAIESGAAIKLRRPDAIRPWQHVLEPLAGYLQLAQHLHQKGEGYGEAWNFGPHDDDAQPVRWIAEQLTQLWGEGARWEIDGEQYPHEAHYLKLSHAKAQSRLGWRPRLRLADALEWTVRWQRAYLRKDDLRLMCEDQISTYQKLAAI